ncbi:MULTISPECIES: pilus assembly protein TadG-related protein [unclassified Pseudomonas]|uniref:pilus assembly protein TadG-related protein n=1 Tax=unclassified Pseudomonas TaxID=196821 RepID=UPI0011EFD22B|nr:MULTISPECIES: pilus assembly protein TadG-related protein [unclassified Pseudomonas]KAA0949267.1 hypothetical protein FQ182_06325 [Pseudomonas sp. ANT_H4]KAA0953955.1 hypothetical protein FQ186_01970 [Pseudomonas sp. ANT_H14]
MSPRLRSGRLAGYSGQRGAIGLIAVCVMALALVCTLLVVDSGRLYLEKRKLQSIADTAALEAAGRGGQCAPSTTATDYAKQNATRNGFTVIANDNSRGLAVTCGTLVTNASNIRVFNADASKNDAIRVVASHTVTNSIANGVWNLFSGTPQTTTTLSATAVGALAPPVAQLTIRSTLGTINSAKSEILNKTIGGLLGGSLALTAVGWEGLANTDVNLLSYLDQLAIQLHVTAGDYQALLNAAVSPTQLINAAVKVLQVNGTVAAAIINNAVSIEAIAPNTQLLKVGDLLKVATGTPAAALNTNVKLFELIQGVAQLSSSKSAVSAAFQLNIPLVGNASITTKVIEPPQLSAIGNPALAKAGLLTGTNQIFVRTAQVRTLISLEIPVLKGVSSIASAVVGLTTPVTGVVNSLLHLNLAGVLNAVLCLISCEYTDVDIASKLDIYIEAASGESHVTDFSCANPATKSLTVLASSSLATLAIGNIDPTKAFSSLVPVDVQPIRLIDIGTRHCVAIVVCSAKRTPNVGGGFLLKAQSTVGQRTESLFYSPVAEMNLLPTYKSISSVNIINSLGATLSGLQVTYAPPTGTVSSGALASVAGLLTTVTNILVEAIQGLLAPLLDPLVNTLLSALGISLGNAEIGANLSCHMGQAYLVI